MNWSDSARNTARVLAIHLMKAADVLRRLEEECAACSADVRKRRSEVVETLVPMSSQFDQMWDQRKADALQEQSLIQNISTGKICSLFNFSRPPPPGGGGLHCCNPLLGGLQ